MVIFSNHSLIYKTILGGLNMEHIFETETRKNSGVSSYNISFMRVCEQKKELFTEDEKEMKNILVDTSFDGDRRIISLIFDSCYDENYMHMKASINDAKEDRDIDYATRYNNYYFSLEFDSEKEISCGGDVHVSRNRCYVDEQNNSIVFYC